MAESVAIMIFTASVEAASTDLDLIASAASIEMAAYVYFRGAAVTWFSARGDAGDAAGFPTREERDAVLARLRTLKDLGDVRIYACSRAKATLTLNSKATLPHLQRRRHRRRTRCLLDRP